MARNDRAQSTLAEMRAPLEQIVAKATGPVSLWWDDSCRSYVARTKDQVDHMVPSRNLREVARHNASGGLVETTSARPDEIEALRLFVER